MPARSMMAPPVIAVPRQRQRRAGRGALVIGLVSFMVLATSGFFSAASTAQVGDPDSGRGEKAGAKAVKKDAKKVAKQEKKDSEEVAKMLAGETKPLKKKRNLRDEEMATGDLHKKKAEDGGSGAGKKVAFVVVAGVLVALVFGCKQTGNEPHPRETPSNVPDETPHQEMLALQAARKREAARKDAQDGVVHEEVKEVIVKEHIHIHRTVHPGAEGEAATTPAAGDATSS